MGNKKVYLSFNIQKKWESRSLWDDLYSFQFFLFLIIIPLCINHYYPSSYLWWGIPLCYLPVILCIDLLFFYSKRKIRKKNLGKVYFTTDEIITTIDGVDHIYPYQDIAMLSIHCHGYNDIFYLSPFHIFARKGLQNKLEFIHLREIHEYYIHSHDHELDKKIPVLLVGVIPESIDCIYNQRGHVELKRVDGVIEKRGRYTLLSFFRELKSDLTTSKKLIILFSFLFLLFSLYMLIAKWNFSPLTAGILLVSIAIALLFQRTIH